MTAGRTGAQQDRLTNRVGRLQSRNHFARLRRIHASIVVTFDRYGHLLPNADDEALARIAAYTGGATIGASQSG